MGKARILQEIKGIMYDIIDNNGNFRTVPTGVVGSRRLSDDRIKLLQHFVRLLRDTSIITQETKMYLFTRYINIRGVNELMNENASEKGEKPINYNTTMSKIGYDRLKLERTFGSTFLSDILFKANNEEIIAQHTENVIKAYMKYGNPEAAKLREGLALELDNDCLCVEISEEKFNAFINAILPYLKSHMAKVASEIDKDSVGYFNYLLTSPIKNDIDSERLAYIKQLLDPKNIQCDIKDNSFEEHYEIE